MSNTPKKGFVIWFTGLSGAGKSTIADNVYNKLINEGYIQIERLDGDIVRQWLTKDLGFSREDRHKNLERVCFVAKLLSKNNVGVFSTFISPYKDDREFIKNEVTNFIEVFVNSPLEVCEERDIKGLYKKARSGEIQNFTGISDTYENPQNPDIELHTDQENVETSTQKIINYLKNQNFI